MSKLIDILALPKGVKLRCEVCRKTAIDRCIHCLVTYYCCPEHRELDWRSIHRVICGELKVVRGPQPFPPQEEQRQIAAEQLRKRKIGIQNKAEVVAKDMLLREHPDLAIPAAMQSLLFAVDLFGLETFEIITPFLLLAEANLDLGNVEKAFEFVCQAEWVLRQKNKAPVELHIKVNRVVGRVHLKKEDYNLAKEAFSEVLYFSAEEYGTEDLPFAIGFGYMGLPLAKDHNEDGAVSCFRRMADPWFDYALEMYINKTLNVPNEYEMEDKKVRMQEWLLLESQIIFRDVIKCCQGFSVTENLDFMLFKVYVCLVIYCIRFKRDEEKEKLTKDTFVVSTRTRQTDATSQQKTKYVIEILGGDYLYLYDRKHRRPRTIATKYLEKVKRL